MMKKLTLSAAVMALCACTFAGKTEQVEESAVGMANPASVFCVEQGGKSEIRKKADGSEYGVCRLPNGQTVEEWEYFRANSKK